VRSETEFGFVATVTPEPDANDALRFTLPAKPLMLDSLTPSVATEPGVTVTDGGENAKLKSGELSEL